MRELANVLTRMPKAATQKLPVMPITLNSRMISDLVSRESLQEPEIEHDDDGDEALPGCMRNLPWVAR